MKGFGERNEQYMRIIKQAEINLSQRGFTLVEIMVAVVILSIGFLAIASMQISAVNTTSSANSTTESTNLAQIKLEELMALQYTRSFTDPNLICDAAITGAIEPHTDTDGVPGYSAEDTFTDWNGDGVRNNAEGEEPYTDSNGNERWDFGEPYVDSNVNGIWDAAHVDPNPPPGYLITWSVIDNRPVNLAKYIRMYVTQKGKKKTILFTCIKGRGNN